MVITDPGYDSKYEKECSLLNPETGKTESFYRGEFIDGVLFGNGISGVSYTDEKETILTSFNYAENKEYPSFKYEKKLTKICNTDIPLAVFCRDGHDSEGSTVKEILLVKPEDGSYTVLDGFTSYDVEVAEDAQNEHLYIVAADYSTGKGKNTLTEICPECLTYSEKLSEYDIEKTKPVQEKCGDQLSETRKKADEIEKQYGIEILIGNEFKGLNVGEGFELYSTENPDTDDQSWEAEMYEDVFKIFTNALAKYPKDFFGIYKDYRNVGGMRFIFVEGLIQNGAGVAVTRGLSEDDGCYSTIFLATGELDEARVHHEIWHSVEAQITMRDPEAFSPDEWSKVNPQGFQYTITEEGYMNSFSTYGKYILNGQPAGSDVYFVRDYSTRNPYEDRATLFEPVMDNKKSLYNESEFSSSKEYVLTLTGIKGKLEFLQKQYEKWFGEKYW